MAEAPLTPDDLRECFPSGAFANLIFESGGEVFSRRIPVPDAGNFTLLAPCAGRFFVGIYGHRWRGEPAVAVQVPASAEKGQAIHFS